MKCWYCPNCENVKCKENKETRQFYSMLPEQRFKINQANRIKELNPVIAQSLYKLY